MGVCKRGNVRSAEPAKDLCDSNSFGCAVELEEGEDGCGMWLHVGFSLVGESEKLDSGVAAVPMQSLSMCARLYQVARKWLQLVLSH